MKAISRYLPWLIVLALMPALYVASFIPISYGIRHGILTSKVSYMAYSLYQLPIYAAGTYGPEWVDESIRAYGEFLQTL
jgi:xanthine/uracil/vitamin C permease (AzgA family)